MINPFGGYKSRGRGDSDQSSSNGVNPEVTVSGSGDNRIYPLVACWASSHNPVIE